MIAACWLAVFGSSAYAATSFDTSTDAAVTIDEDVHWWNQAQMDRDKEVTYNGYQYTVYWDAEDEGGHAYLKITRRRLSDDARESITFNSGNTQELNDLGEFHNNTVIGISPIDGRLHVTWVQHAERHHYAMSSEGCLSETTFRDCTFSWHEDWEDDRQTEDEAENRVTYPMYFNDAVGNLYYAYRYYTSREGNLYMNEYHNNGTWASVGRIVKGLRGGTYDLDGTWIDTDRDRVVDEGEPGFLPESTTRTVYPDSLRFDRQNHLHLTWTYREDIGSLPYDYGIKQHDIYYAYSTDFGATWRDSGGTEVANMERNEPIDVTKTSTIAVSIPTTWWRFPIARMEVDSNGQPHIVMPVSDVSTLDLATANLRQAHYWRTMDGSWHSQFVEPSNLGNQYPSIGSIMFDGADNLYYIYPRNELGWVPYNLNRPRYFTDLPNDKVTWQGRDYLNIVSYSAITGVETYERAGTSISSGGNSQVRIRMKNTSRARTAVLYFTTDSDKAWSGAKSKSIAITSEDSRYREYTFDLSAVRGWTGTLRYLRLYPADEAAAGETISIDYVRVTNSAGTSAKSWEFQAGAKVVSAESAASDNWATWSINDLLPEVSDTYSDGSFNIDSRLYAETKLVNFPVVEQGAPGTESLVMHEFRLLGDEYSKSWDFASDAMEWRAANHVSGLVYSSGTLTGTITGNDSAIDSADNVNAPIGTSDTVRIRMKNSTASGQKAIICWNVDGQASFEIGRCSSQFNVTADNAYHTYDVAMSGYGSWAGADTLTRLRVEPSDTSGITSGTFYIDYVRVLDR